MKLLRNSAGEDVEPCAAIFEATFGCAHCKALMLCTEHDFSVEDYDAYSDVRLDCGGCGTANWLEITNFPNAVRVKLFADARERWISEMRPTDERIAEKDGAFRETARDEGLLE